MRKLSFIGNNLEIDGNSIELEYNISDARIIKNRVVVIYKFDELVDKTGQFKNCIAFDENGKELWVAEHPTNQSADSYVSFLDTMDNRLWNFACFICTIDYETGKLKNVDFTK